MEKNAIDFSKAEFLTNRLLQMASQGLDQWQQLVHEEDRERILDEIVNVLNNGFGSYAYRVERGPGNYRYVRDRVKVLYEDEKPMRIDGVTIDIDDIRKSRLNLELSQQRLRSIVDSLPDPVFISTRSDGKVIFANEVFLNPKTLVILVTGGFLVGFVARYAGGCTSGHAISGLSSLQLPSLIAVLGFFAGGLLMIHVIFPLIF